MIASSHNKPLQPAVDAAGTERHGERGRDDHRPPHVIELAAREFDHRDPFDRMIIARPKWKTAQAPRA
ncbi:MAG TPA: hypothetical protein VF970_11875 [Gemmatimonadales bacterium]